MPIKMIKCGWKTVLPENVPVVRKSSCWNPGGINQKVAAANPVTQTLYKLIPYWVFLQDSFNEKTLRISAQNRHRQAPTRTGMPHWRMPRPPLEHPLHRVRDFVRPNRQCRRAVKNCPCIHPFAFVGGKLWHRG